ncbi:ino80 chromatin remodeling complex protein [Colletotrichum asianum]
MGTELVPLAPTPMEHIEQLAKTNSVFSDSELEDFGDLDPTLRRKLESTILRRTKSPIISFLEEFKADTVNRLWELVEYADNQDYSQAKAKGEAAEIKFEVHPGRILVRFNDNGLTPKSVDALCDTSSIVDTADTAAIPSQLQHKFLFKLAWKMHWESNGYSFSFVHRDGDLGTGMFSPIWEEDEPRDEPLEQETSGGTCITLFLHKHDEPQADLEQTCHVLREFEILQNSTCELLLTTKVENFTVSSHDAEGNTLESTTITLKRHKVEGQDLFTITRSKSSEEAIDERVFIHDITFFDAPSKIDDESTALEQTDVVIAFELTHDPRSGPQPVWGCHHAQLKSLGLKFLLQADFDVRDGIPAPSKRNQAILDAIATHFVHIVESFSKTSLGYHWARWLPQKEDAGSGTMITPARLHSKIKDVLNDAEVFRTRTPDEFQTLSAVRRIPDFWLDGNGDPLFPDTDDPVYPAKEYENSDLDLLSSYGLKYMTWDHLLARIKFDMRGAGQHTPRWSPSNLLTNEKWRCLAAKAILHIHHNIPQEAAKRLRKMPLIPLSTTQMVTAAKVKPIYFPSDDKGLEIPTSLSLHLVLKDLSGVSDFGPDDQDRHKLFNRLGVQMANTTFVRDRILSSPMHEVLKSGSSKKNRAVERLRYLFLSDEWSVETEDPSLVAENLVVMDTKNRIRSPAGSAHHRTYLKTTDPYGPWELLKGPSSGEGTEFDPSFLHEMYTKDEPAAKDGGESWTSWLHRYLSISTHLPLVDPQNTAKLSPEFEHVYTHHPDKFIGALQRHWHLCDEWSPNHAAFIENLRNREVICNDGRKYRLSETFLPLPEVREKFLEYVAAPFAVLDLDEEVTASSYSFKWGFLVLELRVKTGVFESMEFYLDVLKKLSSLPKSGFAKPDAVGETIIRLYEKIQALFLSLSGSSSERAKTERSSLWQEFQNNRLVWVPGESGVDEDVPRWATLKECVWKAPHHILSKHNLEERYRTQLEGADERLATLEQFFQTTLGIADWSFAIDDMIVELSELRRAESIEEDVRESSALHCYKRMDDILGKGTTRKVEVERLRKTFTDEQLIYVRDKRTGRSMWLTSGYCFWSFGTISPLNHISINSMYPDFNTLFVKFLGVHQPDFDMVYKFLLSSSKLTSATLSNVKAAMLALNMYGDFRGRHSTLDPAPLLKEKIFPVRHPDGKVTLEPITTEFFIMDRKNFGLRFASKVKLLDFTVEETHALEAVFVWLRMGDRYLSFFVRDQDLLLDVYSSSPVQPYRDIKRRAYALCRIAAHCRSPRWAADKRKMYQDLTNLETYETDGICRQLSILQDGQTHYSEIEKSDGIFWADNEKLYVPRDPARQDVCYHMNLPKQVFAWMMRDPSTGRLTLSGFAVDRKIQLVAAVINMSESSVPMALVAADIDEIDWREVDNERVATTPEAEVPHYFEMSTTPTKSRSPIPVLPNAAEPTEGAANTPEASTTPTKRKSSSPEPPNAAEPAEETVVAQSDIVLPSIEDFNTPKRAKLAMVKVEEFDFRMPSPDPKPKSISSPVKTSLPVVPAGQGFTFRMQTPPTVTRLLQPPPDEDYGGVRYVVGKEMEN